MGISVEFYLGACDGIESILLDNIDRFRSWYQEVATDPESRSAYSITVLNSADRVLQEGRVALQAVDHKSARAIDELVESFVGEYCDWGPGHDLLQSTHSGSLSVETFRSSLESLHVQSNRLLSWWDSIRNGRPVGRDAAQIPYCGSDADFRISFATADEIDALYQDLIAIQQQLSPNSPANMAIECMSNALQSARAMGAGLIIEVA